MADRVKIVGPHPWTGATGVVIKFGSSLPGCLKVRIDDGYGAPHGHTAVVSEENVQFIHGNRRTA